MKNHLDYAQYNINDIHRLIYCTMDESEQKDFIKLFFVPKQVWNRLQDFGIPKERTSYKESLGNPFFGYKDSP